LWSTRYHRPEQGAASASGCCSTCSCWGAAAATSDSARFSGSAASGEASDAARGPVSSSTRRRSLSVSATLLARAATHTNTTHAKTPHKTKKRSRTNQKRQQNQKRQNIKKKYAAAPNSLWRWEACGPTYHVLCAVAMADRLRTLQALLHRLKPVSTSDTVKRQRAVRLSTTCTQKG